MHLTYTLNTQWTWIYRLLPAHWESRNSVTGWHKHTTVQPYWLARFILIPGLHCLKYKLNMIQYKPNMLYHVYLCIGSTHMIKYTWHSGIVFRLSAEKCDYRGVSIWMAMSLSIIYKRTCFCECRDFSAAPVLINDEGSLCRQLRSSRIN